jgi:hypothetical protein
MSPPVMPLRLFATEYVDSPDFLATAEKASGLSVTEMTRLLETSSDRIRKALRLGNQPIQVSGRQVRITDIAGLIKLSPTLELEVAPKFLGDLSQTWREDFFVVANLTRHGRLLSRDHISASHGNRGDLASLIGYAMASMFWENHRRPLRTYRSEVWNEFSFDGDVDVETVVLPERDGYRQERLTLSRSNFYNTTIQSAVRVILPEVRNIDTRRQLTRVYEALHPQVKRPRESRTGVLPNRHRRWQPLFDLSRRVLDGFGMNLSPDKLNAPGFVMETWRAWEDLVLLGVRAGLRDEVVSGQQQHLLGTRHILLPGGDSAKVFVTPDVTVGPPRAPKLLVDAKYKTRVDSVRPRIAESDVYEAIGFMKATNTSRIVLSYPKVPQPGETLLEPGVSVDFERIDVAGLEIVGIEVEIRGISGPLGFQRFSSNLGAALSVFL